MHVRVVPVVANDVDLLAIFIEKSNQTDHSWKGADTESGHEVGMLKTRVSF